MQGQLFDMIDKINRVNEEFNDSENLDLFILQLRRFNMGSTLKDNQE